MSSFRPEIGRSIEHRTIISSIYVLVQVFAQHGLRLLSNLLMTRILAPDAFGLMVFVTTLITAFSLFTDIGIRQSVAREQDGASKRFLRVCWMLKILRGCAVALCVIIVALLLFLLGATVGRPSTVYADPTLPWLVIISSIFPILQGFESINKELALRKLMIGRVTVVELLAQAAAIASMLAFASFSPTVWALLVGMIVGQFMLTVFSHLVFVGPRMALEMDWEVVSRVWMYGRWLLGSSVFTFFARNSDRFILAALLSSTSFGIYAIARIWVDMGTHLIIRLTSYVGFSFLGEVLRERPADVKGRYRQLQSVIDALCMLSFLFFAFGGQWLINVLYRSEYSGVGQLLQSLSLLILVVRFEVLNQFITSIGDSKSMMVISAIRAFSILLFLPLSYTIFGFEGALVAVALSPMMSVPYAFFVSYRFLGAALYVDGLAGMFILVIAIVLLL